MNERLNNLLIRFLYLIPLAIFVFTIIGERSNLNAYSSFNIKYLYVYLIPIVIFGYQSIRNSKLGWILVMLLYSTFLVDWIYRLLGQYSMIGGKYTYEQYFSWWIFVILYLGLGYVYFKFRPKELMI